MTFNEYVKVSGLIHVMKAMAHRSSTDGEKKCAMGDTTHSQVKNAKASLSEIEKDHFAQHFPLQHCYQLWKMVGP